MTQDRTTPRQVSGKTSHPVMSATTYYSLLGLTPDASAQAIRQAYRERSKLYHPDTTTLPAAIATAHFQQLNEAYATLSSLERRQRYDQKIGFSRIHVIQPSQDLNTPISRAGFQRSSSAYLDPGERSLSPGELFALFILGVTFIACLVLALTLGLTRSETMVPSLNLSLLNRQPTEAVSAQRIPTSNSGDLTNALAPEAVVPD